MLLLLLVYERLLLLSLQVVASVASPLLLPLSLPPLLVQLPSLLLLLLHDLPCDAVAVCCSCRC
jgi:hypothetical protein